MAAANTDKFRKVLGNFSTTLSSGITDSATTIPLSSASGLPTDTAITLILGLHDADGNVQNSSNWELVTGVISGNNLTNALRGEGSTSGIVHASAVVVEDVADEETWNDMISGILVEHGQDGTHTDITADSIDLNASDDNIQVASADPWRTIALMPGLLKPTTTSGCAEVVTVEAGTNDIDYGVLDFDTSSDENAFANVQMPDSWDAGVVQFRYVWTNAGGGAAETVVFELSGVSLANDDAIDTAVGTPIEVSDTWIAQGDIHISAWSGDVTIAGTPAAGEYVHFEIMRDVSEDDLTGDARLMAVQIRYKQDQFSD